MACPASHEAGFPSFETLKLRLGEGSTVSNEKSRGRPLTPTRWNFGQLCIGAPTFYLRQLPATRRASTCSTAAKPTVPNSSGCKA